MPKKMMRTIVFALAFLVAFYSIYVNLVSANPYQEIGSVPPDAYTSPPKVTIFSPLDTSILANNTIPLTVNVTLPESSTAYNTVIYSIICQADWQSLPINIYKNTGYDNSIDKLHPSPANHYFYGTVNLTNIPQGTHTLNVTAIAGGFYLANDQGYYRFMINGSSSVTFYIDIPKVKIISIEDKTYQTDSLPLTFIIDKQYPQLSYSLDGKDNVTLTGNATVSGLSNGLHNIKVYATNSAGISVSDTKYFSIKSPEPFPTMLIVAASIAVIILVGTCLLVYVKKWKR